MEALALPRQSIPELTCGVCVPLFTTSRSTGPSATDSTSKGTPVAFWSGGEAWELAALCLERSGEDFLSPALLALLPL